MQTFKIKDYFLKVKFSSLKLRKKFKFKEWSYSMNFKLYSSKCIDYDLNFIHCLFQFQTLCFDVRREIFEVQRLNLWKSNSNLWNSKHCFQNWNYILWNSNFNLRHSKLFFGNQTLIIELQRIKFKLLNIPIIIWKIQSYVQTLLFKIFFEIKKKVKFKIQMTNFKIQ